MWVDSHCHVSPLWYEPVETLLEQMFRHEIAQAVLVQMLGQTDNSYLQQCLRRFPGRFACVVLIDVDAADSVAQLSRLVEAGATAIRLRPTARSPGNDPLALWRAADELDIAVSCVGNSAAFCSPDFAQLIEKLPHLRIVLEHLGGTSRPEETEAAQALHRKVMELAKYPNVYLKVPGLGELQLRRTRLAGVEGPFDARCPEPLAHALQTFGAPRLMWGSDFPVVSSREGYGNALRLCRRALSDLSTGEQDEVFGGVARRVFKLTQPPSLAEAR